MSNIFLLPQLLSAKAEFENSQLPFCYYYFIFWCDKAFTEPVAPDFPSHFFLTLKWVA
jgi:hypothetical protein